MSPMGLGIKSNCAGEGQQQFSSQSVFKGLTHSGILTVRTTQHLLTVFLHVSYDPHRQRKRLHAVFGARSLWSSLRMASWEMHGGRTGTEAR
jgi:hypothetical protein